MLILINISLVTYNVLLFLYNYKRRLKLQYKIVSFQYKLKLTLVVLACLFYIPAFAAGSSSDSKTSTTKSTYYYDAMKLIKNKSFVSAIKSLKKAEMNSKNDPDIYNYLGFANRKLGNLDSFT